MQVNERNELVEVMVKLLHKMNLCAKSRQLEELKQVVDTLCQDPSKKEDIRKDINFLLEAMIEVWPWSANSVKTEIVDVACLLIDYVTTDFLHGVQFFSNRECVCTAFQGSHRDNTGTLLHYAISMGCDDIALKLIEVAYAEPKLLFVPDANGVTPLHEAVLRHNVRIAAKLVEAAKGEPELLTRRINDDSSHQYSGWSAVGLMVGEPKFNELLVSAGGLLGLDFLQTDAPKKAGELRRAAALAI